jgi:multidrug transporter EmrE-like cation transporter
MNYIALIILFLSGVVLTVGDVVLKYWVEKGQSYHSILYVIGVATYLAGSLLLVESYKHDVNIAIAGILQIMFNTIVLVLFTYLFFKEPLATKQIIGIFVGMVSIYLLL